MQECMTVSTLCSYTYMYIYTVYQLQGIGVWVIPWVFPRASPSELKLITPNKVNRSKSQVEIKLEQT